MSCTFPSKLQADYVELVNEYLDRIPIQSMDDFSTVGLGLQSILSQRDNPTLPAHVAARIYSITEIVHHPEMYVQDPAYYATFRQLVLVRVAAKIHELNALSQREKERYIADQNISRDGGSAVHRRISSPAEGAPGTDCSLPWWKKVHEALDFIMRPHPEFSLPVMVGRGGIIMRFPVERKTW